MERTLKSAGKWLKLDKDRPFFPCGWLEVIFVHPMYAESAERAVAYEAQAIARCRRYGQEKVVP